MKIVIPGGTGSIGRYLTAQLRKAGHEVVILSRGDTTQTGVVHWDGRHPGPWHSEVDGADVVLNLAGRSVDCRYTKHNLTEMYASRVDSTLAVGEAIAAAQNPPRVWLQMSTATIYSHRFDAPNDEHTGVLGGDEADVPGYWRFSIDIARAWEQAQAQFELPNTRSVALRTAMVMTPSDDGAFGILDKMVRRGLGGTIASGAQYMSWIHGEDFLRSVLFLIDQDHLQGVFNLASPNPIPQKQFMKELREARGVHIGLPATRWMVELGAIVLRTDSELILKSRRVVPARLLEAGFEFGFEHWRAAATDLVQSLRRAA